MKLVPWPECNDLVRTQQAGQTYRVLRVRVENDYDIFVDLEAHRNCGVDRFSVRFITEKPHRDNVLPSSMFT